IWPLVALRKNSGTTSEPHTLLANLVIRSQRGRSSGLGRRFSTFMPSVASMFSPSTRRYVVRVGSFGDAGVGAGAGDAVGAEKGETMRPGYAGRRRRGGRAWTAAAGRSNLSGRARLLQLRPPAGDRPAAR